MTPNTPTIPVPHTYTYLIDAVPYGEDVHEEINKFAALHPGYRLVFLKYMLADPKAYPHYCCVFEKQDF